MRRALCLEMLVIVERMADKCVRILDCRCDCVVTWASKGGRLRWRTKVHPMIASRTLVDPCIVQVVSSSKRRSRWAAIVAQAGCFVCSRAWPNLCVPKRGSEVMVLILVTGDVISSTGP